MKDSIGALLFFSLGVGLGRSNLLLPEGAVHDARLWALWALYVMLFAIGMGMGFDIRAWRILAELKTRILLVPSVVLAGTLAGGFAAWLLIGDMSLRDVTAVSAGLGYYSLSSVMLSRLADPSLGAMALLANMVRELSALVLPALCVRLGGPLGPLAAAGAASDTCLPVIARHSGERCAVLALFSGVVLTALVPVILTALYAWS